MRHALVVCILVLAGAHSASAQTLVWKDRAFVNVSFGAQPAARDYETNFGFALFDEAGTADLGQTVKGGNFVDITAGVTPFARLGVAFTFMKRSGDGDGAFAASLPDPIFYDRARALTGSITALQHDETWIGALIAYQLPPVAGGKIAVTVLGGPAVARVQHEIVTDVAIDAGNGQVSASLSTAKRDLLGFQIGGDVTYLLTRHLGAGGFVRVSEATGNLSPSLKVDVGGVQYGAGVRLRF